MNPIEISQLEKALRKFDKATERLTQVHCGEGCLINRRCEQSGICRKAVEQANLECIRYHYTLDKIEKEYGAVPREQVDRYLKDLNKCVNIVNQLNQGDSGIWGILQQICVRRDLARNFKTY